MISLTLRRLSTINRAAINILKLESADFTGVELDKLVQEENRAVIGRLLARARRVGHASEHVILKRENTDGGTDIAPDLSVALTAASLPDDNGVVLVIEDLSELIAAQRASAWQEVARRMAHEIKNPLTPIQLSAERIAKRCAVQSGVKVATPAAAGFPLTVESMPEANADSVRIVKEGNARNDIKEVDRASNRWSTSSLRDQRLPDEARGWFSKRGSRNSRLRDVARIGLYLRIDAEFDGSFRN